MATCFAWHRIGQLLEPEATLNDASGGFAPSEVIEVAVNPAGLPSGETMVITETPDACSLKLARRASVESVTAVKSVIALFLNWQSGKGYILASPLQLHRKLFRRPAWVLH